ncbi:hypothetical protein [Bacillus sp. FJAT-45350]|uniref:hypothetical protein n=1 Tax=Bacillus sp. FJAT-45350 TaxID=2011014 RepID=UPI000BB92203|nr:hypothetical protein [Bacillus sp. FJAT-45350]
MYLNITFISFQIYKEVGTIVLYCETTTKQVSNVSNSIHLIHNGIDEGTNGIREINQYFENIVDNMQNNKEKNIMLEDELEFVSSVLNQISGGMQEMVGTVEQLTITTSEFSYERK